MCCSYMVRVEGEEIEKIKEMGREDFLRDEEYLRKKDGYCLFLDSNRGCTIYTARPSQCRYYPFYFEIDQIDIDLSCPGVGRGKEVGSEVWRELEHCSSRHTELDESLYTGFSLLRVNPPLLSYLQRHSDEETNRELTDNFFTVTDSKGTHLANGKVRIYSFSLSKESVYIDGNRYQLCREQESYPILTKWEENLLKSYLSVWVKRKIYKKFVAISSSVSVCSQESVTVSIFTRMIRVLTSLTEILSNYWKGDISREEFFNEAIRALDGRLRENCRKVNFSLVSSVVSK